MRRFYEWLSDRIDFGEGPQNVVKLSDESGKHTGHPDAIALAKKTLGIT